MATLADKALLPEAMTELLSGDTIEERPLGGTTVDDEASPEEPPEGKPELLPGRITLAPLVETIPEEEASPEAVPEVMPEETPEETPDATPEGTKEETPEETPEGMPEKAAELLPGTTAVVILAGGAALLEAITDVPAPDGTTDALVDTVIASVTATVYVCPVRALCISNKMVRKPTGVSAGTVPENVRVALLYVVHWLVSGGI